ncbi:Sec-independent protein translocase protein TatC [Myxococcaceae bacterium]|nr:Sec-independent protein translocase protein TatC [Myxococcaceae bacterium]
MDETRLPLTAHLAELRTRIARMLVAIVIGAGLSWTFREEIFGLLLRPALDALAPDGGRLQALAPGEMFFTYVKCSLLVGFVVSLPVVFWEIWGFVAPGLYPSERRLALPFVLLSTALFVAGGYFGYEVVFPIMFSFFAAFENQYVEAAWTMREVFSFTVHMFLAFGVAFELPVAVFFLALAGVVDARQLLRGFKYAVLGAFVISAVLTPTPDIVTQTLLAGPLILLYLLGVGAAWIFARRKPAAEESSEPQAPSAA